jgi:hypothetical protein
MGSFWLFLNGDRAWIHLIEGPYFTARDPAASGLPHAIVEFRDDTGSPHPIAVRDTVSRDQGLRALRLWMPHAERLAELTWTRA